MEIEILDGRYSICRLPPDARVDCDYGGKGFFSMSLTSEETSVVCSEDRIPAGARAESGWACMRVKGHLDFSLTGVLASISSALAEAGVSVFAISTFDTDYFLVRWSDRRNAEQALRLAGFRVASPG